MQPAEDDSEQRSAIGKAIVIRRTELGLSRNDLRDRSGLSYPYVAELEKGAKRMSAASLDAVSGALELRPAELLAMADALADDTSDFPPAPAPAPSVAPPAADVAATRAALAPELWPVRAPSPAFESSDAGSRWFRARKAKQVTRERVAGLRAEGAAKRKLEAEAADAGAEVDADVHLDEAPEDARIRAIVRDELRKAGIDPDA